MKHIGEPGFVDFENHVSKGRKINSRYMYNVCIVLGTQQSQYVCLVLGT